MTQKVFKIFDQGPLPRTLFHGLHRSRALPLDTWLQAERKLVRDGTGITWYESGFHVTRTLEQAQDYLTKFTHKDHRRIVPVLVRGPLRAKTHSRHPVLLADEMMIPEASWR